MAAPETELRDAIVADLQAQSFTTTPTFEARYDQFDRSEGISDTQPAVVVVPGPRSTADASRGLRVLDMQAFVFVQQKLTGVADRNATIDALLVLAEEIESRLVVQSGLGTLGFGFAEFADTEREPYDLDLLTESNVFQALIQPLYKVAK